MSLVFATLPGMVTSAYAYRNVELEGIDDADHRLTDFIGKGKWVVLNIWGTGCPPCLDEVPELVHFHDRNKDNKAMVVGIAIDFPSYGYADKDEVKAFVDDYLIDFPVLLGDASVTEDLGLGYLKGLPSTYLYNPQGTLVGAQVGALTDDVLEYFISSHEIQNQDTKNKKDPSLTTTTQQSEEETQQ